MTQDEPFNELPGRRVADRFLYSGSLACLGLAREIDRILYRRKIDRERKASAREMVRRWTASTCVARP